ncbi:MAG TPA: DNA mismatch repair endonuclease MutL, partial [Kofleriaceae bacterium]|nr:DNA mismatch repair endonuclease MutL [Kofleriaceae bacterium]
MGVGGEPLIAVLPSHVIDQIAAGEVIERPASVVKELADNAIDAGARTISIETTAGGRGLLRVADDGCGMSAGDAVLAFERHATSKLRAVADLWGLSTMGFRGEALPSIASVSRLVLTTRRAGDLAATRIAFEGGRRISVTEVGAPAGTTVEVTDLLFNVPARLKFLKGEATEAAHVTDLVGKLAMAYPQVHFRLRHNGRTALEIPPDRDGFARARALLGPRIAARMIPVSGGESGIRVTAYLGAPDLAQTTARGVQLFVGKRPVRDRGLLHAITMGYGELVPRGRYPVATVLLDVPAGAVDVNVHPQKSEVRFADPAAVAAAVRHVVAAGVAASPWRAESGAAPVHMIASVAPPALPFDGHEATPLAQRYARDLGARVGQAQLSLEPPAPAPAPSPSSPSPRAWVQQVRQAATGPGGAPAPSDPAARRELDRVDAALAKAGRRPGKRGETEHGEAAPGAGEREAGE